MMSGGATMEMREREKPMMPMNPAIQIVPNTTETSGKTTPRTLRKPAT